MKVILPPARPRRDKDRISKILKFFELGNSLPIIIFVRGYYLDSMGVKGKDDLNIYDDAAFLVGDGLGLFESYNANTNPSVPFRGGRYLAQLNLGRYRFAQGLHKGKYKALRSFPEGVTLPCTRNGELSTCSHINIHKGSTNPKAADLVWSEGCLTIPDIQYGDFIARVYDAMDRHDMKTIDVILLENRGTHVGQRLFDSGGRIVA